MLSSLSIAKKTYLQGFIQLTIMTVVGVVAILQMNKIGKELIDIAEYDVPLSAKLTALTEHQLQLLIYFERTLLFSYLADNGNEAQQANANQYRDKVLALKRKINTDFEEIASFTKQSTEKLHTDQAKQVYREVSAEIEIASAEYQDIVIRMANVLSTKKLRGEYQWIETAHELELDFDALDERLVLLLAKVQELTMSAALQAEHDEQDAFNLILIVFFVAVGVGLIVPTIIARSITKPLYELGHRLEEVASGDGDLTMLLEEDAKDETGAVAKSFNHFLIKLRGIISDAKIKAEELGGTASNTVHQVQDTLENVQQQRAATEQVASALSQLDGGIQEVAQATSNASNAAAVAREQVGQGRVGAQDTQDIIEQLSSEVNEAATVIQNLVKETDNIGIVLETIRGIAEQTNLLALNAAIEAARAGESGRGFAVVADEVRSLAQRTQESTGSIQELVQRLQSEANNAVNSMQKGTDSASLCLDKSRATMMVFSEAVQAMSNISDLTHQIAASTEQQSLVSRELTNNVKHIRSIAESTSESATETAETNDKIVSRINSLHTNLAVFKV